MSKYEVGDKAAIEILGKNMTEYIIEDYTRKRIYIDKKSLDGISEPISAYIEPLERKNENKQKRIEKLVDRLHNQAAEITRLLAENKELKEDFEKSKIINLNAGRLAGQNEAWELARKIAMLDVDNGYSNDELKEIFGTLCLNDIFNLTYTTAAAKVAQWEKTKEEIKVGDVVRYTDGNYGAVLQNKHMLSVMLKDGSTTPWHEDCCRKTGRHIDIDSFLKQIGGESDE